MKKKVKIIKGKGGLGFGNTNPSAKLEVSGSSTRQLKKKKISYKRNTKVSSRGRKNEVNNI